MTKLEILIGFETEINEINNELTKPSTDDSLFWLNQAIHKFVKTRFNGDFTHKTGYEQTEKRRNDLVRLYDEFTYTPDNVMPHSSYDQYTVTYPPEFLYALNEDVIITDNKGNHEMDTCVFECTQDSFMYRINNSLTDFHYRFNRARPIRVRNNFGCYLLTDKNYKVKQYTLGYIRKPKELTLNEPREARQEYEDFDDSTMHEIIKIAAQMYLENKKDERYQTITAEVMSQE